MRTTTEQDRAFIAHVITPTLLEEAIEYLTSTYSAEELYGKEVLEEWASENNYISEGRAYELEERISELEDKVKELEWELNDK